MLIFTGGLTEDNFLLFYDGSTKTLQQLNLANESVTRIPLGQHYFKSPAYDPVQKKVYWTENNDIEWASLNGTSQQTFLSEGGLSCLDFNGAVIHVLKWHDLVLLLPP